MGRGPALTAVALLLAAAPPALAISRIGSSHQPPGETNWKCDCPGARYRQFLPGDGAEARRWAASIQCAAKGRCPKCQKKVEINEQSAFASAEVDCICAK